MKAYKVEIKPTEEQKIKIHKTMGNCKFVYNLYLHTNKEEYKKTGKFISGFTFSKWLNNEFLPNNKEYLWLKETSSKATKQSIMYAERAFKAFFKGKGKFPRFKKKTSSVGCYLPKNSKTDFIVERHRIKIPTFGFVRVKEYGYIPLNAEVKSGTITKVAHKYFISILCKKEERETTNVSKTEGIGVDLGLKDFAISSTGKIYSNTNKTSKKIKKYERKLKREQRAFSRKLEANRKRKKEESNLNPSNLRKNQLRLQKLHYKLQCIRKEYVRYVVNSLVKTNPKFITIEDLNIKGMMKNRHLSKAIGKQNFYYFREFLQQQCSKYGIEVRITDRFYPSSKKCSCCGGIKKELKLSDRVYKCNCGNVMDRDLNASINIRECKSYKIAA